MTPDPQRQAFLDMIIAEPHEDVHRLVYADWIDERGESERAALIRVQCELEPLRKRGCTGCLSEQLRRDGLVATGPNPVMECDFHRLKNREQDLLKDYVRPWVQELIPAAYLSQWSPYTVMPYLVLPGPSYVNCEFRRGFISTVRMNWPDWNAHADEITRQHPIEEVRLLTIPEWGRTRLFFKYYLVGRERWHMDHHGKCKVPELILDLLNHNWPHIKFTLPESTP